MGANLLLIAIPEKHPERTLEDRLAIIGVMTSDEAGRIFEAAESIGPEGYDNWLEEGETPLSHVQAKLTEAVRGIHNGSREVTWLEVGDLQSPRLWLTGGMSWGDDPTEIWSAFSYLVETEIL